MDHHIPLSFPVFSGNENLYTQKAISSGHLATSGQFINMFEGMLSKRMKTHESVTLNSGTSALHLGMILLGIGPGDEVICQSFTFCASANPIVYLGASPIFVDSEVETWNICPELLEETILSRIFKGKKPKAIVIVHLFGISNDTAIIQRAKLLSTQAREDMPFYHHLEIGYNYKMNNLSAAVGLAQLEQLDSFVKSRRELNKRYRTLLKDFPGVTFQDETPNSFSNYWLTTILIEKEKTGFSNVELKKALSKKEIESRFLWKPLHTQPVFSPCPYFGGNVSEKLFESGLCLPSSVNLSLQDQELVVEVIHEEFSKIFK